MANILILNMEMPKNCCYCGFVRLVNTKACCFAVHDNHKDDDVIEYDVTESDLADTTDKMQTKPSWCPLIPVPEHGRLGDLDELYRVVGSMNKCSMSEVIGHILDAPTVLEAST